MTVPGWIAELPIPSAPMSPDELKRRLAELGLSQSEAARRMGVNLRSLQRWIAGETDVPAMAVALLDCWRTIQRLRKELDG